MRFVHLNVHSNYSFCRGASRLEELVVAARRRGMDRMALTDTNGLYGLVWFLDAAKAAGITPIVGAEIDLRALAQRATFPVEPPGDPWTAPVEEKDERSGDRAESSIVATVPPAAIRAADDRARVRRSIGDPERDRIDRARMWGRAVVLVKDAEGYARLCRLLSSLHHGGDWPPPERREEQWEAMAQLRVADRIAGHLLRGHRREGAEAPTGCDAGGDGDEAGKALRMSAVGKGAAPGTMKRGARSGGSRPAPNPKRRRAPEPLTRAWLARALADLTGCIVLSADAGLLESVARLRSEGRPDRGFEPGRVDLYVELRPGVPRRPLLDFSRRAGIPPVATGGVHFADRRGWSLHRLLRAIDLNRSFSGLPDDALEPEDAFLVSPEEIARRHPDCPEAVENASRIADLCRFTLPRGAPIFPAYDAENPANFAAVDPDPDVLLERDCIAGIERRYGAMTAEIRSRLDHELAIIREKGFAPYFLVVRDIVARAPRTCGRGSAAASLVSYALGITHVDPIRYDLFFERFLNRGRVDPPDIDVDFPWDERDDVLDWTFRRYGRARTAMISNHVTFQARASVREIAKVYGLTDEEIGRVTKRMPWFTGDVAEATATHPVFQGVSFPPPWPEILALARTIDGYPRGLSVHCGGVVVVPDAIDRHVPVQPAAKGVDIVQWEKDQSEDAGLVKIDLLGNRSLAVIRDACRAVRENGGPEIRFEDSRPVDDERTRDLIRRGETVGVFYVESPAMRQLQAKCGVGDFEHLVIHSSIIRPAANEYIREYVRRLRGGEWTPLHPLMGEILAETYGIMVYQEDVSKIAIALAGFDAASADGLRKILSKKNKEERLRDYRERFFRGAAERGVGEETVRQIWDMILSFAGYSFCKPHSASYALVSFKSASLRAHHPGEFMAAVISNGGGYYSAFAYISEARRMGLEVLLPDVNESRREYTGRTFDGADAQARDRDRTAAGVSGPFLLSERCDPSCEADEPRSSIDTDEPSGGTSPGVAEPGSTVGTVRVGLMQLKGFPDAALDALLAERARDGPFASFDEFLERAGSTVGPAAIRILIRAGTFDSLLAAERSGAARFASPCVGIPLADSGSAACPEHRGDLFWRLAAWERSCGRTLASRLMNARAGSAAAPRLLLPPVAIEPLPRSGAYDERTMLDQEIESLGFLISRHPLSLFRREIAEVKPVPARELPEHVGRLVRVVGWYVTGKTVQTRKGEPMEFLSFEDTTALYETTFFPGAYARFCHMMTKVRPYVLTGRVEEDFGAVSLNVSDVRFLDARGGLLRGGEDSPVSAPHVGGTSPGSEAWGRSFTESARLRPATEMDRVPGARTALKESGTREEPSSIAPATRHGRPGRGVAR